MLPSMAEMLGDAVFVQKGSTLKVMEEFNIQGKQTSFYKYCPGIFGYTLVYVHPHRPVMALTCFERRWLSLPS